MLNESKQTYKAESVSEHVYGLLYEKILSGEWPVDSKIPNEFDLCDAFGASRISVRSAIQRLISMGNLSLCKTICSRRSRSSYRAQSGRRLRSSARHWRRRRAAWRSRFITTRRLTSSSGCSIEATKPFSHTTLRNTSCGIWIITAIFAKCRTTIFSSRCGTLL